ncbi:MAG TPA: VTT domain-containing protein [Chitinophagaceae bacterium]
MDHLIEIFKHLINPEWILNHGGLWLLVFIIFAETGLFIGFFLPGDSLLFVTGMVLAKTIISGLGVVPVLILVSIAGVLGNFAGYWFGKKSGPLLFKKEDTFLFKKRHLIAAHEFYEKHGGGAIIFARFLPFIRTFAPIVAGIVQMEFKRFAFYNITGSLAWVFTMILSGYFLGRAFPWLGNHIELIVLGLILITTAPVILKLLTVKKKPVTPNNISSNTSSN